jgi:nucleolar MIF4G domain-containing protein 1
MDDAGQSKTSVESHSVKEKAKGHDPNDKLLALATKNRMNSDVRRAIFCILMGSQDYEDAFMKLLKADLLEKDVVRVLTDCCAREQVYNPFYSLLGGRLCEYSSSMKFTFQLAYWDMFNHFNDCDPHESTKKDIRLSNNLAKLLAHLLKSECLKLSVLRRLDITRSSISEPTAVFLTVLFTDLFETISDSSRLVLLMSKGLTISSNNRTNDSQVDGEDVMLETDWTATFKESLSAFFMKYLQSSPKNIKSSVFERNLKAALKMCDHDDF